MGHDRNIDDDGVEMFWNIRRLAVSALTSDNGINEETWEELQALLEMSGNCDITKLVDATDGGFYLPEDIDVAKLLTNPE